MPPRRKGPMPDSLSANPRAAVALEQLFVSGAVRVGDKARVWYNDKGMQSTFSGVNFEKFRKRFKKLHVETFLNSDESVHIQSKSFYHLFIFLLRFLDLSCRSTEKMGKLMNLILMILMRGWKSLTLNLSTSYPILPLAVRLRTVLSTF